MPDDAFDRNPDMAILAMLRARSQQALRIEMSNGTWREARKMGGEEHGRITMRLLLELATFIEPRQLGQLYPAGTNFILQGTTDHVETFRSPDIGFVRATRVQQCLGMVHVVPDLVVEVIAITDDDHDIEAKMIDYIDAGVECVWQVFPETQRIMVIDYDNTIRLHELNDILFGNPVLPGFQLPLRNVFGA